MGTKSAWTPERRAQQALAIQRWRPWDKSTGPRTEAGKARSSRNADRGVAAFEARILELRLAFRAERMAAVEEAYRLWREKMGERIVGDLPLF